jgi:hypothetical protein
MKKTFPGTPKHSRKKQRTPASAALGISGKDRHKKHVPKMLILGGYGRAGSLLAEYLLRETPVELVIAGRDRTKAEQAAERLRRMYPGRAVSGCAADARDASSLRSAFAGAHMILVASTTTADADTVARSALECGADYLDIQYSRKKNDALRALEGEILKARRCFITEAGFHPGLPSVLVRYAALSLDQFDKARIASVVNMKARDPMPSSMVELVEGFQNYDARVFRQGRWQDDASSGALGYRKIDFREPFGVRKCAPMMWEELRDLPEAIPSLKELGSYVAGFHPVIDSTVIPVVMTSLALFKERAHAPMAKLLFWSLKMFPPKPVGTALVLEAEGEVTGVPIALTLSVAHRDEYVLTVIPVVAAILQYLKGTVKKPGLWMLGHIVEPFSFVNDLGRMGLDLSLKLR